MALTFIERNTLLESTVFAARIRSSIHKYAIYLRNSGASGNLGRFAVEVIDSKDARERWVMRLTPYVIENVASSGTIVNTNDSSASDDAISVQVETQIQTQIT